MKLIALRALTAAVETGSLRSAARVLGLSQPAVTKIIRELEVELGASLLQRSTRGVVPTVQGQVLFEQARRSLHDLDGAAVRVQQLGGQMVGELAVGAVPLAVLLLIPETLRTFSAAFPAIRLRISEELYIAQLERLRQGSVDVAVGGIPPGLASGEFVIEPLLTTRMVVVVRHGSRWARAQSLRELSEAKWVYTGATAQDGYAKQLYESHDLPAPAVGAVVNSTLALLSLVGSGDFVGLMPVQIAHHPVCTQYLQTVPIREQGLSLQVGAIVRRDAVMSPAVRQFITHLHRAAHQVTQASSLSL